MLLLLPFITCGIWLAQFIDAASLDLQSPPHMRHNATLHRCNNINKYGGCDKMYDNPDGDGEKSSKDLVYRGYQDALRMAGKVSPFIHYCDDDVNFFLPPDPLELRFFGELEEGSRKRNLIERRKPSLCLGET
jgi:hypothetical protein